MPGRRYHTALKSVAARDAGCLGEDPDASHRKAAPHRGFSLRILQSQRATTPPYSDYVNEVRNHRSWASRLLRTVMSRYVADALIMFAVRKHYDIVVTSDYRTSFLFGAMRNLFGCRTLHVVKELYLDERTLQSRVRRWSFRWALRKCDLVITNSSGERLAYSTFLDLPAERVRFLPWPSNVPSQCNTEDEGFIFAAGRSFRDWPTLLRAARDIPARFVVVASREDVQSLRPSPNVRILCDVSRQEYLSHLRRARLVVVPLRPTVRSVGQAVLLEAMAHSKPVVVARVPGVLDYVGDGAHARLYEPGNVPSLTAALNELLEDSVARDELGKRARTAVDSRFNRQCYSVQMEQLLRSLLASKHSSGDGG